MAVLGRNRTLFCFVLRSHYFVWSTVTEYFCYGWGSYALSKLMNTWYVYSARMSPTPNGSSVLQRFERGCALEIRNKIMSDFYLGLPHIHSPLFCFCVLYKQRWRPWNKATVSIQDAVHKPVVNFIVHVIYWCNCLCLHVFVCLFFVCFLQKVREEIRELTTS